MTVTCATVRRAFGEFQCCPICHDGTWDSDKDEQFQVCCKAQGALLRNIASYSELFTHPALLRAIQEETK